MKIKSMSNIPAHSNPYRHDMYRQGTTINDRFEAMFMDGYPNELIIVDKWTGIRKKLIFPPAEKEPKPKVYRKPGVYA